MVQILLPELKVAAKPRGFPGEHGPVYCKRLKSWYCDNRSDPGQLRWVQIPGPGLKVAAKPRGLPRGNVGNWN